MPSSTRSSRGPEPLFRTSHLASPRDWYYDEEAAQRAVDFFGLLVHVKARWAGHPFTLLPWQEHEIIRPVFGWYRPDGTRRFRSAFIEVPSKNGKSELAAGIALKLCRADREPAAEVYSAAADKDQARLVFDMGKAMVEASPRLRKGARILRDAIVWRSALMGAVWRVVSAEAFTKHGINVHGLVFDELHAQPNRDLYDVLTEMTGARSQPLTVAITTAGVYDKKHICWEQHAYAERVARGRLKDPAFLGLVYGSPEGADWQKISTWKRANPSLGTTKSVEYMRERAKRARSIPAYRNTFLRLHLNVWTAAVEGWLPMDRWDACAASPLIPDGSEVVIAVDAAPKHDSTAVVVVRQDDEGRIHVLTFLHYADPQTGLLDFEAVEHQIRRLAIRFRVREIVYDPYHFTRSAVMLEGEGLPVVEFPQTDARMVPASQALWDAILDGKLRHGADPAVREQAAAAAAKETSRGWRLWKLRSSRPIDSIVALAMGVDRLLRHEEEPEPSIRILSAGQ